MERYAGTNLKQLIFKNYEPHFVRFFIYVHLSPLDFSMLTLFLNRYGADLENGDSIWVTKNTLKLSGLPDLSAKVAVDYLHSNYGTVSSGKAGTPGYFLVRKATAQPVTIENPASLSSRVAALEARVEQQHALIIQLSRGLVIKDDSEPPF